MNAQFSDEESTIVKEKDNDGLRLVIVLLCLLFITLVFIVVILYWRYSLSVSRGRAPQIVLGEFLESREAYVH